MTNAEARVATHEDKKAEMQEKTRKFRAAQEKRHEKLGTRVSFSDSRRNSCSSANLQLVLLSVTQALGSPIGLPSVQTGSLHNLEPSRSWSQHVRKV